MTHKVPEKYCFFIPFSYINALSDLSLEAGPSDVYQLKDSFLKGFHSNHFAHSVDLM